MGYDDLVTRSRSFLRRGALYKMKGQLRNRKYEWLLFSDLLLQASPGKNWTSRAAGYP